MAGTLALTSSRRDRSLISGSLLIASPYVLTQMEGYSLRTIRLGLALRKIGLNIFIAAPREGMAVVGVTWIRLPYLARQDLSLLNEVKLSFRLVASALFTAIILATRRRSLALVQYSQIMNPFYTLVSLALTKSLRLKIVYLMEDLAPENIKLSYGLSESAPLIRILRYVEKIAVQSADLIIVPTLSLARILQRASPRKILVVHNVVNISQTDLSEQDPANLRFELPQGFRVVYFGRIDKGLRGLEEAVRSFVGLGENFCFIIIGAGDGRAFLSELVVELGLGERVKIIGPYPGKTLYSIIRKCDAVIIPYSTESDAHRVAAPTKLYEAMALGKPIICPDTPGLREAAGDRGIRYTGNSVQSIREAITRAYEQREALKEEAISAAERIGELLAAGEKELDSYRACVAQMISG